MTFQELTFVGDNYSEDLEVNMGWQAQWEAPNGYLVMAVSYTHLTLSTILLV